MLRAHTVILLVSGLAIFSASPVVDRPRAARDLVILTEGSLGPDDVLYYNLTETFDAIPDVVVDMDVVYTYYPGNITYIEVYEVGESQNASAMISGSAIGEDIASVYYQSDLGRGFQVQILVYGTNLTDYKANYVLKRHHVSV